MLAEAAEIMLGAMRGLSERLTEAETPEAAQGLAMALSRVNRGLRQTILLDARLEKDVQAAARAAEAEQAKAREAEVQAKKHRLRYAVSREILEASDSEEDAKDLLDELEYCLDAYVRGFDFEAGTMEELVEALLADLGVERRDADPPPPPRPDAVWSAGADSS